MAEKKRTIEERLAKVEHELAELKQQLNGSSEPWYRQIAGSFADDPVFAEIVRLGRQLRYGRIRQ